MSITAEDHIAIERLMYLYARCADRKDYAGFSDVFLDDAVFDYSGNLVRSCAEIQVMMRALEKYHVTQHQVHNVLYDVEDSTAEGETYCLASHLIDVEGDVMKIDMGITYRDTLRRTDKGWRIAHRVFDLLWSQTTKVDEMVGSSES